MVGPNQVRWTGSESNRNFVGGKPTKRHQPRPRKAGGYIKGHRCPFNATDIARLTLTRSTATPAVAVSVCENGRDSRKCRTQKGKKGRKQGFRPFRPSFFQCRPELSGGVFYDRITGLVAVIGNPLVH